METPSQTNLRKEVLALRGDTSSKYVPEPHLDDIMGDTLVALKNFKNNCRWKEFWRRINKKKQLERENPSPSNSKTTLDTESDNDRTVIINQNYKHKGLKTGLKPLHKFRQAPKGSDELEYSLRSIERIVLNYLMDNKQHKPSTKDKHIKSTLSSLSDTDLVAIPTDKTNSIQVVNINDYKKWMQQHISTSTREIPRSKIIDLHKKATDLANHYEPILSKHEFEFLEESIDTKAIPTPKLLIKDHKKMINGHYPTRLVIPATNFTATFSKLGYLGLKSILDENNITYNKHTITQASNLKEKLEKLKIKRDNSTIASLDIENMYPSVRFSIIKKAVTHYTLNLPTEIKEKVRHCLNMIEFGMQSCLITFDSKYFEYRGDGDSTDKGLAIGGYESAFLADLVASFLLEKTNHHFENTKFHGIYRDDGLVIFNDNKRFDELANWLENFQTDINTLTGGTFLQFTMEVWKPNEVIIEEEKINKCTKIKTPTFPFLDMKIQWTIHGELSFRAYSKPGQLIQYVDNSSTHRRSCLRAIPQGVLKRLGRLTSNDHGQLTERTIDQLYPEHVEALSKANLLPPKEKLPKMKELWRKDKNQGLKDNMKKKYDRRAVYFVHGHSKFWSNLPTPLHSTFKKIFETNNLPWLKVRMAYRKYRSLGDLLNSDLCAKLQKDQISLDYEEKPCNCNPSSRINDSCPYKGKCRASCIVYKATCKDTGKFYIGNTQQAYKKRMAAHYSDVRRLVLTGKKSDSFASHFSSFFDTESKPTPSLLREKIDFSILWQGNPLSVQKSFGTRTCRLCLKESTYILKKLHTNPNKLINHNSEIYTSCHHKTRFHRFPKLNNGTDEPRTGRKSRNSGVTPTTVCTPVDHTNQPTHMLNSPNYPCVSPYETISI